MRIPILVALSLALGAGSTAAQCANLVFPGAIPPSPWTAAGSPYCVVASVTIPTPLVIQAGTVIEVHGTHSITTGATLTVNGTAAAPVKMWRGGGATSWKGLIVGTGGTVLEHLHVSDAAESGIQVLATDVTLRHCVVTHCRSALGGGVKVAPPNGVTGLVTLDHCAITDNDSTGHAGGLDATMPAGTELRIVDSLIARNRSNPAAANGGYVGGGALLQGAGTATLTRTTIRDNGSTALCNTVYYCGTTGGGGGIWADIATLALRQCVFSANTARAIGAGGSSSNAHALGGGLRAASASLLVENCAFACNSAAASSGTTLSRGSGIYSTTTTATLSHVTFYNNVGGGGASGNNVYVAGGTLAADHCIVFSRTGTGGHGIAGTATFEYSDIEGGYPGTGNFSATPGFANPDGCDCAALALGTGAPVVDMGDPQASANDACTPPGSGAARADVGHLGGPANCGWVRTAAPFTLGIVPPHLDRGWGASPIYTGLDGGGPGEPAAVLLTGFDNTPIAPLWFNDLFGVVCADRRGLMKLTLPLAPAGLQSLQFTGVTLRNGAILFTPPQTLRIR